VTQGARFEEELYRSRTYWPDVVPVACHREVRGIRDVRRLVARYGGRASKWVKKSSPRIEIDMEFIELHWYEHPGLGRFEVKQVRVNKL
jgi:hypothetical protein